MTKNSDKLKIGKIMAYLIYAIDFENQEEIRESLREAHRQHLRSVGRKLIGSGALLDDDGKNILGGISLLDTDDKDEAVRFAEQDPYAKAGIRQETKIIRWRRRWLDGEFLGKEI